MKSKYYVERTGQYVWTVAAEHGSNAQEFDDEAGAIQHCGRMNRPQVQVADLDLYGSASRVIVDGQTVTVRHSAIVKNGRVAQTVRGFVLSIEVSAQLKKLIAEAVRIEAKQQCCLIAAQLEDEYSTQASLEASVRL